MESQHLLQEIREKLMDMTEEQKQKVLKYLWDIAHAVCKGQKETV